MRARAGWVGAVLVLGYAAAVLVAAIAPVDSVPGGEGDVARARFVVLVLASPAVPVGLWLAAVGRRTLPPALVRLLRLAALVFAVGTGVVAWVALAEFPPAAVPVGAVAWAAWRAGVRLSPVTAGGGALP